MSGRKARQYRRTQEWRARWIAQHEMRNAYDMSEAVKQLSAGLDEMYSKIYLSAASTILDNHVVFVAPEPERRPRPPLPNVLRGMDLG